VLFSTSFSLEHSDSPFFVLFVSMAFGIIFSLLFVEGEIFKGVLLLGPFLVFCWLARHLLPNVLLFFFLGFSLSFVKIDHLMLEPGSIVEVTGKVEKVYADDFFLGSGSAFIDGEWKKLPFRIIVKSKKAFMESEVPDSGMIFWAVGKLEKAASFQLSLDSDMRGFAPPIGVDRFTGNLRKDIENKLEKYGLSNALIFSTFFGSKAKLSSQLKTALKKVGISHIFAVSGLHVGLFFLVINNILSLFLLPYFVKDSFSLMLTAAYVLCTGPAISASRAFLMLLLYVVFRIIDYPQSPLNILGLSGIIMLVIAPFDLILPDFQLSFISTSGILLYIMASQKKRSFVVQAFLIGGAAQGATLPITLNLFGSISLMAIPITFIVVEIYLMPALVGTLALLFLDLVKLKPLAFALGKGLEFLSKLFEIAILKLSELSPMLQLKPPYNYFVAFFVASSVASLLFFFAHSEQRP